MKYVFLVLSILTTVFVFSNSLRNREQSANQSDKITNGIVDIVEEVTDKPQNHNRWSYYVRKLAHFGEYAVLGTLWLLCLYSFFRKKVYSFLAFAICALIGIIDEIIQLFVPGRVGSISDVLLDSSGALFAILIVTLILYLVERKKKSCISES